ncbi:AmpG family muropeptide MFS transporter [Brackiella oedipodis]|uniref:AmpG family muropeptide MFS transporter n=1 Tax=Brackiella oedipodis TaxID=124225 RepID=UPI000684192F|nr:MFS transporter [Brackiella oedipodis]
MFKGITTYFSPRVYPLLFLGMASGLPLALTGATLQAWVTVSNVSLSKIGLLTLVGSAYTFKFLWAPLLDRYIPPFLGRRRGWMVVTQVALALVLFILGHIDPAQDLLWVAILATLIAFLSATQDIAFDAYSTEILNTDERAAGAAIRTFGYRLGMIVSGGLAMVLAERYFNWGGVYQLMGGLMLIFALISALSPEPKEVQPPRNLLDAFVDPFKEFFGRPEALMLLSLIILYKLGDAFAGALSTTFLIRGAGFSPETIGYVNKVLAVVATIIGALLGGAIMARLRIYKSLMFFGVLQAFSNLAYWFVAITPKNIYVMATAVGIENLCGGLGTAAFVSLVMGLCHPKFTATQFALLTALASVGRVFLAGPITPVLVEHLDWPAFFLITVLIAVPGLLLLFAYRKRIQAIDAVPN